VDSYWPWLIQSVWYQHALTLACCLAHLQPTGTDRVQALQPRLVHVLQLGQLNTGRCALCERIGSRVGISHGDSHYFWWTCYILLYWTGLDLGVGVALQFDGRLLCGQQLLHHRAQLSLHTLRIRRPA
jgi:hypothetical protein